MKFTLKMNVELEANDDMNTELSAKELFKNGDIAIRNVKCSLLDEDGNDMFNDEDNAEAVTAIMGNLMGGA